MQLLPGDRVLIASQDEIEIHDIASIGTRTSIPHIDFSPWAEYSSPIWRLQMDLLGDRLSRPYLCRKTNTLRFVLNTLDTVYDLIISVDDHLSPGPEPVMLMDFHVPEGEVFFLSIIAPSYMATAHLTSIYWIIHGPGQIALLVLQIPLLQH